MNKKVCVLVFNFEGRGVQRSQVRLASHLSKIGYDVDIACYQKEGDFLEYVANDVNIVDLSAKTAKGGFISLIKYLWQKKPEIVFSAEDHVNIVLLLARLLCPWRFKTSVSCRVSPRLWAESPNFFDKWWFTKVLVQILYPTSSQVVTLSSEMADDYVDLFGLDRNNIKVIFNPVTGSVMSSTGTITDHAWINDSNIKVVLGVGNISWIKGFDTLIKALPLARKKLDLRLIILGEGPDTSKLKDLAKALGVEDYVEFGGFKVDTMKYMRASDVFVLSSLSEGCPNVLLEAICSGCPVISTLYGNGGGAREIMEDGRIGHLVPIGDEFKLSDAIVNTIEHPFDRELLSVSAERFDIEVITRDYLEGLIEC